MSPIASGGMAIVSVSLRTRSSPPKTDTISPETKSCPMSSATVSVGIPRTTPRRTSDWRNSAALTAAGESKHASYPDPDPFSTSLITSPPADCTHGRKPHGRFSMAKARRPGLVSLSHQARNSDQVLGGFSGSRPASATRSLRYTMP